jgi:hypothetical protein
MNANMNMKRTKKAPGVPGACFVFCLLTTED